MLSTYTSQGTVLPSRGSSTAWMLIHSLISRWSLEENSSPGHEDLPRMLFLRAFYLGLSFSNISYVYLTSGNIRFALWRGAQDIPWNFESRSCRLAIAPITMRFLSFTSVGKLTKWPQVDTYIVSWKSSGFLLLLLNLLLGPWGVFVRGIRTFLSSGFYYYEPRFTCKASRQKPIFGDTGKRSLCRCVCLVSALFQILPTGSAYPRKPCLQISSE